jgi:hypothetical protein
VQPLVLTVTQTLFWHCLPVPQLVDVQVQTPPLQIRPVPQLDEEVQPLDAPVLLSV